MSHDSEGTGNTEKKESHVGWSDQGKLPGGGGTKAGA